ncbi:MAG: C4-type zinc ribbon domain-containing protein [Aquificaceae bacterium]|nr:C4-type zinc ribbon domain-containing protein [Aquificaceae bacterium]
MNKEKFKRIVQLQRLEIEIAETNKALDRLNLKTLELTKQLEEMNTKRDEIFKRIEDLNKEIKASREKVKECEERLKRTEERLGFVKKVEEYKALLKEKAKYEDCIIKTTEKLRDLEKKLEDLELEKKDGRIKRAIEELNEELSDVSYSHSRLKSRIEVLQKEFTSLMDATEEDVLKEYERLKKKHGLPVVLPMDNFGACLNCGTKLPSAHYSKLVAGEVVSCPSCGRLVYYEGVL